MEISHYSNSFISVKVNKTVILCDPWVGVTNDSSWLSFPAYKDGAKIVNGLKPNFIYISHLHCDHFDPNLLSKCNKNTTIIIKKFKDQRLKKSITKLGFKKINEYLPLTLIKLNADISISIVPQMSSNTANEINDINYDLDTSIIIKSNRSNKVFLNNVDNPLSIKDYKFINNFVKKKFRSKIHISCMQVGAASEYPQCFLDINRKKEKHRIIEKVISDVKKKLEIIKPDLFFPAGGAYLIYGKYSELNEYVALPSFKAVKEKLKIKNCKIIDIEGKEKLILDKEKIKFKKLNLYKVNESTSSVVKKFSKFKYEYQKITKKNSIKDLDEIFNLSLNNYIKRIDKTRIKSSWTIKFYLYNNLTLNKKKKIDHKKSKLLKKYELNYNKSIKKNYSILHCYLDMGLFYKMLNRIHPWNPVLSGSLILFKRSPAQFNPDVPFSLNYLAK